MFLRFIQIFQAVILWSIICEIDARYRPPPVMTMTSHGIFFFPRQSYCLNLLKVIEDTGGYNGAHVTCQRKLCMYYERRDKYCATNGTLSKTFRNLCLLCAKGCEELNKGRPMFRSEYSGKCKDRDISRTTTDAISTLGTSIRVTSTPKAPITRSSTSQSSTQLTTSLEESTYVGTSSFPEDSSFTIVVNGSTVVVSTTQPFASPFTSVTTPVSPYLSTEQSLESLETLSVTSSTQFTSTNVIASTSVSTTNAPLPTFSSSTLTTDIKTTEIENSPQPHTSTIDFQEPEGQTRQLETDGIITSQTEVLASSEVPTVDQATTPLTTLTPIFLKRRTGVIGTTLSTEFLPHKTMGTQEGTSTQLETGVFMTVQTELPNASEMSVDQTAKLSSHSSTPLSTRKMEIMEPQELQTKCKKERQKPNRSKQKYQINPQLKEQLCIKNDKHFWIKCETMKHTTRYERPSAIPVLPDIY